jgi:hypothetical protein
MLATLVHQPFDRRGWLFEIKWDGYCAIAGRYGRGPAPDSGAAPGTAGTGHRQ